MAKSEHQNTTQRIAITQKSTNNKHSSPDINPFVKHALVGLMSQKYSPGLGGRLSGGGGAVARPTGVYFIPSSGFVRDWAWTERPIRTRTRTNTIFYDAKASIAG